MNIIAEEKVSLEKYNTFRIAVNADRFYKLTAASQLTELYNQQVFKSKFLVTGAGSNILYTKDFDGSIIKNEIQGISYRIAQQEVYVTAGAGIVWNDFVWYCINEGFSGIENMALIPGTVGASPIQNIGAYGTELMDIFDHCIAFNTVTGAFERFENADCAFSYRDSIFKTTYKGQYIITEVTFKLAINAAVNTSYGAIQQELVARGIERPTPKDVAEVVSSIRVNKLPDPSTIGNAGSFFKNPLISQAQFETLIQEFPQVIHYPMADGAQKIAAGWLIEQCGWKGKSLGPAGVWPNQALVLVNLNHATGSDIWNLSAQIISDVAAKFNIELEREVNIF